LFADGKRYGLYTAPIAGRRPRQVKRTSFADSLYTALAAVNRSSSYTAPDADGRQLRVQRTTFADSLCTALDAVNRYSSYTAPDADGRQLRVQRTTFADGLYTAPIASNRLQPRKLIPSGATYGETCSQRATDDIIADDELSVVFAHADSILVCGGTQGLQDLAGFRIIAEECYSTLDCGFGCDARRVSGYPGRVHSLVSTKDFPRGDAVVEIIAGLPQDVGNSVTLTTADVLSLGKGADASDYAITAMLNQSGRERQRSFVGKEVLVIEEDSRKRQLYLLGKHVTVIAGREAVTLRLHGVDNASCSTFTSTLAPHGVHPPISYVLLTRLSKHVFLASPASWVSAAPRRASSSRS